MPTYNIKEIGEMKLVSLDGNEVINLGKPVQFDISEAAEDQISPYNLISTNEFTISMDLSKPEYYKLRNTFIAGNVKKYRYKQIQRALKLM